MYFGILDLGDQWCCQDFNVTGSLIRAAARAYSNGFGTQDATTNVKHCKIIFVTHVNKVTARQ
jgi:hypothetical protein